MQGCSTVSPEAHGCQSNQADLDESLHVVHIRKIVAIIVVVTITGIIVCKSGCQVNVWMTACVQVCCFTGSCERKRV